MGNQEEMTKQQDNYHHTVSDYYDKDAGMGFEARADDNPLLDRIRNDFRQITIKYPFENALEIGCGPGFDVAWFAEQYPDKEITGIDISIEMVRLAEKRIQNAGLENAKVLQCDELEMLEKFKGQQFDLVYVFFGALNTVSDLQKTAGYIHSLIKPGGHAVLTFVNKWYMREMLVQTAKLNFKIAFARIKKIWGGYSPDRYLPSRCYSPKEVKKAFSQFKLLEKKGYSIFYPAWYNYKKFKENPSQLDGLWEKDQRLQKSWLWDKGEYTLFVLRREM